ncbi:MAG TPA: hypothetical protein VGO11_16745 [Chthoniobacteraceae bacterium]|jgi:hypothetical protein|nr:hypothetical protein [Chthoniobacteraceae bacterium]
MSHKYAIRLGSGRDIFLVALNQSRTYEGLLEGLPTKEKNRGIVERTIQCAEELWGGAAYLITPPETPITLDHDYPFGTPASIPGIVCCARFRSRTSVRPDDGDDYSELTFVWFQSDYALPIDESTLTQMGSLDWNAHATDYQY